MNKVSFIKALLEMDEELTGGQKKLDVAEPKGKLTGADFAALRAKKSMKEEGQEIEWPKDISSRYNDEFVFIHNDNKPGYYDIKDLATGEIVGRVGFTSPENAEYFAKDKIKPKAGIMSTQLEGQDHEVSMAQNSLKSIISAASQLMNSLGQDEKDIPAWIQDHITNAENYINQASKNYHEYNEGETKEDVIDAEPNPYDSAEEIPLGDQEDKEEMFLKKMMEDLFEGKKSLKEFGPSNANVSKARFKLEDVINWFTKKQQAKELKHGFPKQFKSFISRLKSHAESENGYVPVNYVYHDINDYVAYWPTEWSREEYAVQQKLQNKHAKELYSAIRSELKMYDRKGNPIN